MAWIALDTGAELFPDDLSAPVDTLTPAELAEEVPSIFLLALEEVVMVVLLLVGGNLLSLVFSLEEDIYPAAPPLEEIGGRGVEFSSARNRK